MPSHDRKNKTAYFGFQEVSIEEKNRRVAAVFNRIAHDYDFMNDVLSWGMHRLWRRFAIQKCGVQSGQRILDLAGGTGDLAGRIAPQVAPQGQVVLGDVNSSMLLRGRTRLSDHGAPRDVDLVQMDAGDLPFPDDSFDCVTIGFGLRNMSEPDAALASTHRVLKPGGVVVILDFSHPTLRGFRPIYDLYSFAILPLLGRLLAGDADSYRYLVESIRVHPQQDSLKEMMIQAGFERCEYFNLSVGIVAVHRGYKEG